MTHRERAIMALTLQQPDYVPTFELEYQLADKVFGKDFLKEDDLKNLSEKEKEFAVKENAEYMVHVYSELGYSIIPIHYLSDEHIMETAKHINRITNNEFLLTVHGDGTFAIPDGDGSWILYTELPTIPMMLKPMRPLWHILLRRRIRE